MRSRALLVALFVTALGLGGQEAAWSSHDLGLFELDANTADGAAAGSDWRSLFPRSLRRDEMARVHVADGAAPPQDTSYFTGGGSKDSNDVTAWRHTTGDVAPDKNEITNAFAVAYRSERDTGRNDVGDLLLYFGLDRYANSGDAQVGFWFFRAAVGLRSSGLFGGSHIRGDLLVLSDFTQGGKIGTVRVYRWVGSGGSDGALDLLVSGRMCNGDLRDDVACAAANGSAVSLPWPYESKTGTATAPAGAFYEGGINLTRLMGGRTPCLKAFMAETRSSQSLDAQLKDFALGPFDTCPVTTATVGPPPAGTVPRAGPPPVSGPQIPASGPSGMVVRFLLGTTLIAAGIRLRRRGATVGVSLGSLP